MSRPEAPDAAARPGARSYPDPCGVARALNLVGERWALLVVRELLLGPKRFSDLRAGLPAISPNVLSQRLDELAARGLVSRRELGPPVGGAVYELSALGAALEPALLALASWGSRAMPPGGEGELSSDALVLALRTTLRPDERTLPMTIALVLGADTILLDVGPRSMSARRGAPSDGSAGAAKATIATDPATLRRVVFGGQPLADAVAAGTLRISGNGAAARRFLARFARPTLFAAAAAPGRKVVTPDPDDAPHRAGGGRSAREGTRRTRHAGTDPGSVADQALTTGVLR